METKLERIAKISKGNPKEVFTSIYHLINKELLLKCHKELDGNKASGIDDMTKAEYNENLQENINKLVNSLKDKTFKPTPAKRVYIPKANGKMRGLAIAIYEDKIVQLALKKLIEAIYEPKFLDCMHGFRHGRGCHSAIRALNEIILFHKVNYIIDADIKGFFDNVDHKWLIKCIEQHIKDRNVINLVNKFLKAGVIENHKRYDTKLGTPQGSILSPVLANIYMHYVLTLWFEKIVKARFDGECYITVYADDFVCCFQYKREAELFMNTALPNRLAKFNLELAKDKTRLIEFGRFAKPNAQTKKRDTFDFLGFTHYCSKSRNGKFRVKRKTSKKKFNAKVIEFKLWLKENQNMPIKELMENVNAKLIGHYQYFGISDNAMGIKRFENEVNKMLFKYLNRRSQRKSYNTEEFIELKKQYPLAQPKIYVRL